MAVALIVAAGSGERLGAERPKAFVLLGGRPMLQWSVAALRAVERVERIVVALPPGETAPDGTVGVAGGASRSESVRAALAAAGEGDPVIVHDAARPLAGTPLFERVLDELASTGADAVVAAAPVSDTIKRADADGRVLETPDRSALWAVQTPQVFRRAALEEALADEAALAAATDDASLVESRGGDVRVLEAPAENIKVTTPLDLRVAELLIADRVAGADHVAIVKEIFDLMAAGQGERTMQHMHPDIVWDLREWPGWEAIGDDVYHGHAGMSEFWGNWLSGWDSMEFDIDELRDIGGARVLAMVRVRMQGRRSGVVVENPPHAQLYSFRDGLVVEIRNFASREEARQAAGLGAESGQNAEIVRELFRRFQAHDNDAANALFDPEVVWDTTGVGDMAMVTGVYHGHEGMVRFWTEWLADLKDVTFEHDDLREGSGGVLVPTHQRAVGRVSGAAVNLSNWGVYVVEDGLIKAVHLHDDYEQACRAAGLAASGDDVEVVREMLRRFAARDNERVYELMAEDVLFDTTGWPAFAAMAGVYHGHAGVRRFWADWFSTFKDVELTHDELQAGSGGVIVRHSQRSVGRRSGAEVDMPHYWTVYTVRDGLVAAVNFHNEEEAARRAAGLER